MMQHAPSRSPTRVSTNPNSRGETSSYKPVRRGRGMTSSAARVRIDHFGTIVRTKEPTAYVFTSGIHSILVRSLSLHSSSFSFSSGSQPGSLFFRSY